MAKSETKPKSDSSSNAASKSKQPNILVIWGDDIGIANLSCYTHGLMGYQTPNIDRLAKEGVSSDRRGPCAGLPREAGHRLPPRGDIEDGFGRHGGG